MTDHQFAIDITVKALAALGSIVVAILAIWGNPIRSRLVGPKLKLSLLTDSGEAAVITQQAPGIAPVSFPCRYYHLRVENQARHAIATDVQVRLRRIFRRGADQKFAEQPLSGPVPFVWQHQAISPLYRKFGSPWNSDLGWVAEGKPFVLTLLFAPNNLNIEVRLDSPMLIEVVAAADEGESAGLWLEISWDMQWSADAGTMKQHMVVKPSAKPVDV